MAKKAGIEINQSDDELDDDVEATTPLPNDHCNCDDPKTLPQQQHLPLAEPSSTGSSSEVSSDLSSEDE